MKNRWKPDTLKASELERQIKENIITIPTYQRGAVWNAEKKNKLVETIKIGLPFGSLLIYKDDNDKKQLIDGLQRSLTIFEFINNPAKFFDDSNIDSKSIREIFKITGYQESQRSPIEDRIKTELIKWVKENHPTMESVLHMDYSNFSYYLAKKLPVLNDLEKAHTIKEIIKPMLSGYKDICQTLLNTEIPVIYLTGDKSILPEVFERINSTGANLTKYQIFSAAWSTSLVKIVDTSLHAIVTHITNRYDEMVRGDIEIEDYDSTTLKRDKEVNVFDLCFGFGKHIKEHFPNLFGTNKDISQVDSIGFNLVNACIGHKVKSQNILNENLTQFNVTQINNILVKIFSTIKEVDTYLKTVTTFKGNSRATKMVAVNHTEYQIVSIIAYVFIQKYVTFEYDENDNVKKRIIDTSRKSKMWNSKEKIFKQNILRAYIIDVLNENWRGSGDKKLDSIIHNPDHYIREITWREFEIELDRWFDKVATERNESKKVANPKETDKTLLNVVYSTLFTAEDQYGDRYFDIEHLATKGLMKDKLANYNDELKLPISSIGNLCYLPEAENRAKGKKTIYDDSEYLKSYSIDQLEKKYTFTTKEDFEWLKKDLFISEFKTEYLNFIRNRFKKIKDKIKNNLF
ncbi:MAG: DUF262 domain-containing protein [Erysipelotrichia bacterium]|nr:DUF262 domain-containing protein [Erysipelotrichia bacterium]